MIKILEQKDEHMIVQTEAGTIETMPFDDYYLMKYSEAYKSFRNDEDRIKFQFNSKMMVEETYDNKIFNVYWNDKIFQMRHDECKEICKLIISNDDEGFSKLCEFKYQIIECSNIIKNMTLGYKNRLRYNKKSCVVDGYFKVKFDGSAWVKNSDTNSWKHICIVPSGIVRGTKIETSKGVMKLSSLMIIILSKITFLLKPNTKDTVFMNQLDEKLKRCIKDEYESQLKTRMDTIRKESNVKYYGNEGYDRV
tara:strand:+ start:1584 stop:2336 length:753 start_codon:yes stop_codon:yes gene_type:complete